MDEERPPLGADKALPVGDVGLPRDQPDLAGHDRDARGPERRQVVLADGPVFVHGRRLVRDGGVERPQLHRVGAVVERHPEGGPGEAREERRLLRVVEVEGVGEAGAPEPRDEPGPGREPAGQRHHLIHVGVEREDRRVRRLDQCGEARARPVEPEVPEEGAEEDHVAQVAAADDKDPRVLRHGGHPFGGLRLQTASVLWRS